MLLHKKGCLYLIPSDAYLLGVIQTLGNENQLIGTPHFKLKGDDHKILLISSNTPRIFGYCNPLKEDGIEEIGSVYEKTLRPVDKNVTDYITSIDPVRKMVDAKLNNEDILVVLPRNFEDVYSI